MLQQLAVKREAQLLPILHTQMAPNKPPGNQLLAALVQEDHLLVEVRVGHLVEVQVDHLAEVPVGHRAEVQEAEEAHQEVLLAMVVVAIPVDLEAVGIPVDLEAAAIQADQEAVAQEVPIRVVVQVLEGLVAQLRPTILNQTTQGKTQITIAHLQLPILLLTTLRPETPIFLSSGLQLLPDQQLEDQMYQ